MHSVTRLPSPPVRVLRDINRKYFGTRAQLSTQRVSPLFCSLPRKRGSSISLLRRAACNQLRVITAGIINGRNKVPHSRHRGTSHQLPRWVNATNCTYGHVGRAASLHYTGAYATYVTACISEVPYRIAFTHGETYTGILANNSITVETRRCRVPLIRTVERGKRVAGSLCKCDASRGVIFTIVSRVRFLPKRNDTLVYAEESFMRKGQVARENRSRVSPRNFLAHLSRRKMADAEDLRKLEGALTFHYRQRRRPAYLRSYIRAGRRTRCRTGPTFLRW